MIPGKDLVRSLAGLNHFYALGDLLRQKIEADAVMAGHRLAHRGDGVIEREVFEAMDRQAQIGLAAFALLMFFLLAVLGWWFQTQHPYHPKKLLAEVEALCQTYEAEEEAGD